MTDPALARAGVLTVSQYVNLVGWQWLRRPTHMSLLDSDSRRVGVKLSYCNGVGELPGLVSIKWRALSVKVREIARRDSIDEGDVGRFLPLAYLAPARFPVKQGKNREVFD